MAYQQPPQKHEMATLAKCVVDAADEGDLPASQLLINAAEELVSHVEGLFNQSDYYHPFIPVTVSGSLFSHAAVLKQHFIHEIESRGLGKYHEPYATPEYGAAMLAISSKEDRKGGPS
jgi:N-acetylglucosamine kinase-like BadF-type ATPase